jgi:gliding motility-associated-like protein
LRWDLSSTNIKDSQELLFERIDEYSYSSIQLAPDDLIYHSRFSFEPPPDAELARSLAAITNPDTNIFGSQSYTENGLLIRENEFSTSSAVGSFPQLNSQWFNERIDIIRNGRNRCELFLCNGATEILRGTLIPGADYTWIKDGEIISNQVGPELEVSEPGFYELIIEPNDGRCPITGWATVELSTELPVVNDVVLEQCDEDDIKDGLTVYNLNEIDDVIMQDPENNSVRYYETLEDLEANGFGIRANEYSNISNPQTIYALVTNNVSGCSSIAEVELRVSVTDVSDVFKELCDNDGINDGIITIDLDALTSDILNNVDPSFRISFYESLENALVQESPIDNSYVNETPFEAYIYARVDNGNNCFGISEITLKINPPPLVAEDQEYMYCLNSFPAPIVIHTGLDPTEIDSYTYLWSTGATSSEIQINETGTYSVKIFNSSGCFTEQSIQVLPSNIASIETIDVSDGGQSNSIAFSVSGEGDYEFSLNDIEGPYQDEAFFDNLPPELYILYIRDKNGCGITDENISVIGFPRFFTPNGDGVNDLWQIKGISSRNQLRGSIRIFDRYGKLLVDLDPGSRGWNGEYNGAALPADDYWFTATLQDGRSFTSHFTLKR